MKKRTLLIATAVAALTAGSSAALAQSAREGQPQHMNPASRNAPAEKVAPSPGTHGTVGAEHNSPPANRMGQAPGTERNNRMGQSGQHMNRETTGQAPNEQPGTPRSAPKSDRLDRATGPNERNNAARPNERNRATTGQGTMENRNGATENHMENRGGAPTTTRSGSRGAAVTLSSEQKSKIHTIIIGQRSAPRIGHVDFDVKVGVAVPRTIHLAPIPLEIVTIEPEWRGFEYFLVGDEIVVVDPATLEIVAVLPA